MWKDQSTHLELRQSVVFRSFAILPARLVITSHVTSKLSGKCDLEIGLGPGGQGDGEFIGRSLLRFVERGRCEGFFLLKGV